MLRTRLTTSFCLLLLAAVPSRAAAQDPLVADPVTQADTLGPTIVPTITVLHGSSLTRSLYVSTAFMQVLDTHSTLSALRNGAVEANPVMSGVTRHPALFIATKAAAATCMVMAARRLGKHNKAAMVATLVGLNSAYLIVVSHNYKLAHGIR